MKPYLFLIGAIVGGLAMAFGTRGFGEDTPVWAYMIFMMQCGIWFDTFKK